jgi:hypothetical protein
LNRPFEGGIGAAEKEERGQTGEEEEEEGMRYS